MNNPWDERYASDEYIYGTQPNEFLVSCMRKLTPGRILLPADGEGRNAVFAARQGWQTEAFDQSSEGRRKALMLAELNEVEIEYHVLNLDDWKPEAAQYDCIALIFVHLPAVLRKRIHKLAVQALKPGGHLVLEAFSLKQLPCESGGPKVPELLYTARMLAEDFEGMEIITLEETQTELAEGRLHQGKAEVVHLFAKK